MSILLDPPPPPPKPELQGFGSSPWQRWFSRLQAAFAAMSDAITAASIGGGASVYTSLIGLRSAGTTYTAGSSPRMVCIIMSQGTSGDFASLTVGAVVVSKFTCPIAVGHYVTLTALVPAGATYVLTQSGGTLASWLEL